MRFPESTAALLKLPDSLNDWLFDNLKHQRIFAKLTYKPWPVSHFFHSVNTTMPSQNFINDRITIDPDLCNGKPTLRGKRIAVQTVLEFLGAGDSEADILEQYPSLEQDDIRACLRFATGLMDRHYQMVQVA